MFGSIASPAGFLLRSVEVNYFRHPAELLHQIVNGEFHSTKGSFALHYRAQEESQHTVEGVYPQLLIRPVIRRMQGTMPRILQCHEDMLHLARPDTEGQRAEGAMGARVGIPADNDRTRKGKPEFRADDVDDPLIRVSQIKHANAVFIAIRDQGLHLQPGKRLGGPHVPCMGRHVMVHGGQGEFPPSHLPSRKPQAPSFRLGSTTVSFRSWS